MALDWVEATVEQLEEYKSRDIELIREITENGKYKNIALKGNAPTMSYKENIIEGFKEALLKRFHLNETDKTVVKACSILNLKNWQLQDEDYAVIEIKTAADHFRTSLRRAVPTFTTDAALDELPMLKKILKKRYGDNLKTLSWGDVIGSDNDFDVDFPMIVAIIELLSCIPPTSVSCETTFSQMKLIKTARRTRIKASTLDNLLIVKLQSPDISQFDPEPAIDQWLGMSTKPRRPSYRRNKVTVKQSQATPLSAVITVPDDDNVEKEIEQDDVLNNERITESESSVVSVMNDDEQKDDEYVLDDEINDINAVYSFDNDKHDFDSDHFCLDFQSDDDNFMNILLFSKD